MTDRTVPYDPDRVPDRAPEDAYRALMHGVLFGFCLHCGRPRESATRATCSCFN